MKFKLVEKIETLEESSLSRLYKHNQSCAIGFVTAFKSPRWIKDHYEISNGANAKREILAINQERNNELEKNIKALGYNYFRIIGSYENQERKSAGLDNYTDKEQSFAVIDTHHGENFVDNIKELGNKYDQESVLIVPAGGKDAKLYYNDGSVESVGEMHLGNDAPFKSLIDGRPMVIESVELVDGVKIKTQGQYNKYKE